MKLPPTGACLVVAFFLILLAPQPSAAADEDREQIEANVTAYIDAYQKKDAAALASFWSESGQFVSPISGETVSGRKKIEQEYAAMFADSGEIGLAVEIESLRFLTRDVAVEEGIAKMTFPDESPSESRYRVIHVKQEGKWLIDSIRETIIPTAAQPAEETTGDEPGSKMEPLAWMIGEWVDGGDGSAIYLSCSWGMKNRFIKREFTVEIEDRIAMNGIEVIGWDASEGIYRSWVFDSEGGFGSATWARDGDIWTKRLTGTTKDGKKAFSAHTIRKIDDDSYEWNAHGRELDGQLLPNIDTVTVIRSSQEN